MSERKLQNELVLPTTQLKQHVNDLLQHLQGGEARFVLQDKHADYSIELNEEIYELLRCILIDISQNKAVQIFPRDTLLTSVQAADFLQVSRPYLIKLINENKLPCQMVGTHRRIKLHDLINYKTESEERSRNILDEMARKAQEYGWEN